MTGRDLQVLDRSVRDVTGAFSKVQVMIRDGDVGHWPGYDAMSYPLLAPSAKAEETRAAIAAADAVRRRRRGTVGAEARLGASAATRSALLMGRQNVPRDQWLELGYECPHCGEQITEADVYAWRPVPEDPKLLLLWCPNCGDRVEINHI